MSDEITKGDVISFLEENEKYISDVKGLLKWEEENKRDSVFTEKYDEIDTHWQATDVGMHGSRIYQLEVPGIVERVSDSNSITRYRLSNREAVRGAVEEINSWSKDEEKFDEVVTHEFPSEDDLPDDLFDKVIGFEDVKWLIRRSLTTDEITNFLLIGPSGSAKTVFLLCLKELQESKYIFGPRMSGAGFTEEMFTHRPKYVLIDEFDDTEKSSQKALASYMESGIVEETKYDKSRQMKINTKTFAAGNKLDKVLDHIQDRFNILKFDPYTEDEFMDICRHVLPPEEGVSEEQATEIGKAVWGRWEEGDVRKAIQVARLSRDDPEKVIGVLDEYSPDDGALL